MPKEQGGERKNCFEHIEIRNFEKLYAQNTIWRKKRMFSAYIKHKRRSLKNEKRIIVSRQYYISA